MKKILKITFGLVLVFTMVFGIGFASKPNETTQAVSATYVCAVQEEKQSEVGSYFEEKIMPYVVSVASGFIVILIGLMPVIKKMLKIIKDFKTAKEALKSSNDENLALKKEVAELKNDISEIKASIGQVGQMVQLGFCNTKELVVNGYANEIAKVGKKNEENEK